jgi:hypothetical protein
MRVVLGIVTVIATSISLTSVHAADKGYFDCFKVSEEQKQWFKEQPMAGCCELSDGQPTPYEIREDGYYIPPYSAPKMCQAEENAELNRILNDKTTWIRVADDRVKKVKNLIGFAVVWWENNGGTNADHKVRCFIPMIDA